MAAAENDRMWRWTDDNGARLILISDNHGRATMLQTNGGQTIYLQPNNLEEIAFALMALATEMREREAREE